MTVQCDSLGKGRFKFLCVKYLRCQFLVSALSISSWVMDVAQEGTGILIH